MPSSNSLFTHNLLQSMSTYYLALRDFKLKSAGFEKQTIKYPSCNKLKCKYYGRIKSFGKSFND